MNPPTIEDALREIRQAAAFLRYFASAASCCVEPPDKNVFGGLEDICDQLQRSAEAVRRSLSNGALDTVVRRTR